ncbi:MAG: alpha-amylase [Bacteroidales bacterium]|jgi:glycosidase|nr:alpha-amylase [Bacteroidales bacterium]
MFMKKFLFLSVAVLGLAACSESYHPEWTYDSVVYEVNVRQFSPEGTFKGVEAQLPRLKDLGVDVLWLMPMYQIGEEERKGSLGSYYAISDYKAVNPEFGTMEDFEHLLSAAHEMGFKVILDWVANQTAPDHVWMTDMPAEFYERDAEGNAIWEYDWTDTRSLNYENEEVWWAQDDAMRFWLEKGVDGFRCDAAGEVPAEFWYGIMPKMNKDYPEAYFLAEAERENLADSRVTFDANYAWELHHLLNSLAQGSKTVQDLKDYVARDAARFPKEAFRLTFTSNHDENSWSGTEFEREGAAADACAVLCFTLPGSQPLIYTGQEIGLDRRLAFFEKDPITDWSPNEHTAFWKKLVELKHNNPALAAGEKGGKITWWEAPEGWVAFHREVKGNRVIVIANFGVPVAQEAVEVQAEEANDNRPQGDVVAQPFQNLKAAPVTMTLNLKESYKNAFTGEEVQCPVDITLAPGEYLVLTK